MKVSEFDSLKELLDDRYLKYNRKSFIQDDPILIPHQFSDSNDIEVSAFFAAIMAWGSRKVILNKMNDLMYRMGHSPFEFILNYSDKDKRLLHGFVHRTLNDHDLTMLVSNIQIVLQRYGSLRNAFYSAYTENGFDLAQAMHVFRTKLINEDVENRLGRYLSDPFKNSACKRLNMFLRWMVRVDNRGVDFGLWTTINPAQLFIPLDLHSGRTARSYGLLHRSQNDWKSVLELTQTLRKFDPVDPVKYDFALFGMGVNNEL